MNKYKLMRMSAMDDENSINNDELSYDEAKTKGLTSTEKFKEEYKDFYTDIKISIKEDW